MTKLAASTPLTVVVSEAVAEPPSFTIVNVRAAEMVASGVAPKSCAAGSIE
jgi:hypothetical protein